MQIEDDDRLRSAVGSAINGFCQTMPGLVIPEEARPHEEDAITEACDAFITVYNDLYDRYPQPSVTVAATRPSGTPVGETWKGNGK